MHICSVISATSYMEHVPEIAELWDNLKLFVSIPNLCIFSSINRPSCPKASRAPEIRVRAQRSLNAIACLMYPALAVTTEDCIATYTYSCLTDTKGIISRFLLLCLNAPDQPQSLLINKQSRSIFVLSGRHCAPGPLMPLHFLCIQRFVQSQKITIRYLLLPDRFQISPLMSKCVRSKTTGQFIQVLFSNSSAFY